MRKFSRHSPFLSLWLVIFLLVSLLLSGCGSEKGQSPGVTPNEIRPETKIDTALADVLASYKVGGIGAARETARLNGVLDDADRVRFGLTLTEASAVASLSEWLQKSGAIVTASYQNYLTARVGVDRLTKLANNKDFWQELSEIKTVRDVKLLLAPPSDFGTTLTPTLSQRARESLIPPLTPTRQQVAPLEGERTSEETLTSTRQQVAPLEGERTSEETLTPTLSQRARELNIALNQNQNQNQGVSIIGADKWQKAGFTGKGVKIGIIDGGFNGYRNYLGSALPQAGQVTFKSFIYGGNEGREAHGIAVAEVIASLAPDVQLFLVPIEDEIGFAQAADWLVAQKVQIIHASLAWGGLWPGDGTGLMNERLDAARKSGVLPIVSAGNYAQSHYMRQFKGDANNFHLFGDSKITLKLTTNASSSWVALRWDEKWDKAQTNLDLFLLDANRQPMGSSRNFQGEGSNKPPLELVPFIPKPNQPVYIQVRAIGAVPPQGVKFHLFAYNATLEEYNSEQSIATPGDAKGALTIGATFWQDDKLESYSSRGPTADGRTKPELVAPTRVNNQVFGQAGQTFSGTSAAAPQVSGTVALIWSAAPDFKPDDIIKYLRRNALSLSDKPQPLLDPITGYGRVKLGSPEAGRGGSNELLGAVVVGTVWEDNFSSIYGGLPDNNRAYHGKLPDGTSGYFVQSPEQGIINWNTYEGRTFEEFRAEFSFNAAVSPQAGLFAGLIFWQRDPNNYYLLGVSDNYFAVLERYNNSWKEVIGWRPDAALNARPVRLSLEATKGYLKIKAGDILLQSIALDKEKNAPGGKLGFAVGSFATSSNVPGNASLNNQATRPQVIFSNLIVTPLDSSR